MYLKIIYTNEDGEKCEEEIHGITLTNGYQPCITHLYDDDQFQIPQIEPALWFKTLILTAIILDCNEKEIETRTVSTQDQWPDGSFVGAQNGGAASGATQNGQISPTRINPFEQKRSITQSRLFRGTVNFHTEEVSEVFELTADAVRQYISTEKTQQREFYEAMFRILHCYVLPLVTFTPNDLTYLQAAYDTEMEMIKRSNEKIKQQEQDLDQVKDSLQRIREKLVNRIITTCKDNPNHKHTRLKLSPLKRKLRKAFHQRIMTDLEKDVMVCASKLNGAQMSVDVLTRQKNDLMKDNDKVEMADRVRKSFAFHEQPSKRQAESIHIFADIFMKNTKLIDQKLALARGKRDKIHEEYKNSLYVREIVKQHTEQIKRSKKKFGSGKKIEVLEESEAEAYVKLNQEKEQLNVDMLQLILEKIFITSVKEAVSVTLSEIETEKESYGVSFCPRGIETNLQVIPHGPETNQPLVPVEWKTLEQKIWDVLNDSSNETANIHCEAYADFVFRCGIIDTWIGETSSKSASTTCAAKARSPLCLIGMEEMCQEVTPSKIKEFALSTLGNVNRDISNHLDVICRKLLHHFEKPEEDQGWYEKLWTCYERIFFSDIMNSLENLYRVAYKEKIEHIENYMERITPDCVSIGDSQVLMLLQDSPFVENVRCLKKDDDPGDNHYTKKSLGHSKDLPEPIKTKHASDEQRHSTPKEKPQSKPEDELSHLSLAGRNSQKKRKQHSKSASSSCRNNVRREPSKYVEALKNMTIKDQRKINMSSNIDFGLDDCQSKWHFIVERKAMSAPLVRSLRKQHKQVCRNLSDSLALNEQRLAEASRKTSESSEKNDASTDDNSSSEEGSENECAHIEPDYQTIGGVTIFHNVRPAAEQTVQVTPKLMKLKPQYKDGFQDIVRIIEFICKETSLSDKLRKSYKALHKLGEIGTTYLREYNDMVEGISTDDLNDLIIVLFCNMDSQLLERFFINIQLMGALLPQFHDRGPLGFSIAQFQIVSHFMSERLQDCKAKETGEKRCI